MLTEKGRILLLAVAVILFIAWQTQIELIYFIASLLMAIILSSYLFSWLLPADIRFNRSVPDSAYENQILKVNFILENRSPFAAYYIRLTDNFSADLPHNQKKTLLFSYLGKRQALTQSYEGLCFKRGVWWLGPLTITSADPLGIFKKEVSLDLLTRLTVYPQVFNICDLPFVNRSIVVPRYGPQTSRRSGDYEEFFGIRQYHQEDGLRKIHWPSTAKHRQLMVRHFEQTGINTANIIIDLKWENNLGEGKETTLECAVKIAASLTKYFLDQGFLVQLLAYGDTPVISSFGNDPSHFSTILGLLSEVQANGLWGLAEALTRLNPFIPPTSTLAVVRLDKDEEVDAALEQIIYAKNLSLIDIQLDSFSFDASIQKGKQRFLEVKGSQITGISVSQGDNLELKFMAK